MLWKMLFDAAQNAAQYPVEIYFITLWSTIIFCSLLRLIHLLAYSLISE